MKTNNTGFDFIANQEATSSVESRKLGHTTRLIDLSKARAIEVMRAIADTKEPVKKTMVDQLESGKAEELIKLIESTIKPEDLIADSTFLADCTEEEFSKLLESRRSDRSKKLKAGATINVTNCSAYIGAMYAEMLIRIAWNKPYAAGSNETMVDESDITSIQKKIKSLQSKKCRLKKTAEFVADDRIELEAVEAEIARLSEFRPTITTKQVIKSVDTETIREALLKVQATLSVEDLDKFKKAGLL